MRAYYRNRSEADETALANDPVAEAVRALVDPHGEWSGTATELLDVLGTLVSDEIKRSRAWPAAPNALSNRPRRLAPSLRASGMEYSDRPHGHDKTKIKTLRIIQQ